MCKKVSKRYKLTIFCIFSRLFILNGDNFLSFFEKKSLSVKIPRITHRKSAFCLSIRPRILFTYITKYLLRLQLHAHNLRIVKQSHRNHTVAKASADYHLGAINIIFTCCVFWEKSLIWSHYSTYKR